VPYLLVQKSEEEKGPIEKVSKIVGIELQRRSEL